MAQTAYAYPKPFDQRAAGSGLTISNEKHIIGEDDEVGWITLEEAPETAAGVTISGYTRVTSAPAAGQFRVYADAAQRLYGKVEFHSSDDNKDVQVSYVGMGTPSAAALLRRIRAVLRSGAKHFLAYQTTVVADYDAMLTAAYADLEVGDTLWFKGNKTYTVDKTNLGSIGKLNITLAGGGGAVIKKKTTGTFGATNTEHIFYDKTSASDGLTVVGLEFDLSRSSATNGNTVSAFMMVRCDRLKFRFCKFKDGIEEGLKLYKCQDVTVESCEFNNIRNNGIQCHAPSSDGYTGAKGNRGWERFFIFNSYFVDIDDGAGGALDGEGITFNSTDNAVTCRSAYVYGNYLLRCIRGIHSEANPQGGSACWIDDLHFWDNTIRDAKCYGLIFGGCRYSHAHHNTIINPGQTGNVTGFAAGLKLTGTQGATNQPNKHCRADNNIIYDDRGGSAQMECGLFVVVAEDFDVRNNDARGSLGGMDQAIIDTYCTNGFFLPGNIMPWVRAVITASSSHGTSGSYVDVPFGATEKWNKIGTSLHDPATNNERFKVPTATVDGASAGLPGIWKMRSNVILADGSDTTKRGLRLVLNTGSVVHAQASGPAVSGDQWAACVEASIEMTLSEYMRVQALQATGGSLSYDNKSWAEFEYTGLVKPMGTPLA